MQHQSPVVDAPVAFLTMVPNFESSSSVEPEMTFDRYREIYTQRYYYYRNVHFEKNALFGGQSDQD